MIDECYSERRGIGLTYGIDIYFLNINPLRNITSMRTTTLLTQAKKTLKPFSKIVSVSKLTDKSVIVEIKTETMSDYIKVEDALRESGLFYVTGDSCFYHIYLAAASSAVVPTDMDSLIKAIKEVFKNRDDINMSYLQKLIRQYAKNLGITKVYHYALYDCRYHSESIDKFTEIGWGAWEVMFNKTLTDPSIIKDGIYIIER